MPEQYDHAFVCIEARHPLGPTEGTATRSRGEARVIAGNRMRRPAACALRPAIAQRQDLCAGAGGRPTAQPDSGRLSVTQAKWHEPRGAGSAKAGHRLPRRLEADPAVVRRGGAGGNESERQDRSRRCHGARWGRLP